MARRRPKSSELQGTELAVAVSDKKVEAVDAQVVPASVFRELADRVIADKVISNAKYSGFAIGVGVAVILVGAGVIAYLVLRRRDAAPPNGLPNSTGLAGVSPITIINQPQIGPSAAPGVFQGLGNANLFGFNEPPPGTTTTLAAPAPMSAVSYSTTMRSYTLSSTSASRVFTAAGDRRWRVQARNIGPPGSFAIFSTDPAQLLSSSYTGNDVLVVPAGGDNTIDLRPRDVLYARGNVANVNVAITAGVAVDDPH